MLFFYFVFIFILRETNSANIYRNIIEYFQSDSYRTCDSIWKNYRVSYENVLSLAIKQEFSYPSMNLYINSPSDLLELTDGYYHNDSKVQVFLKNMVLGEFPYVIEPQISFPLCSHALTMRAYTGPMNVHATYMVFRNRSDITYSVPDHENSPFQSVQVQNIGQLAITVDRCLLSGEVLTTFSGFSMNVGYNKFKLSDCEFNIEIFSRNVQSPPVITNFLLDGNGLNIEKLIIKSLNKLLVPQVQAAFYSHLNTSAIFGKQLIPILNYHETIVKKTQNYVKDDIVDRMNTWTVEQNKGMVNMDDFHMIWDDAFGGKQEKKTLVLKQMTLSGLESAYSAHIGGPMKLSTINITEQVRISNLRVTGRFAFGDKKNRFAAEIYDAAVDVTIDVSTSQKYFEVVGWRSLDVSCCGLEESQLKLYITGYLLINLPKYLESHMSNFNSGQQSENSIEAENKIQDPKEIDKSTKEEVITEIITDETNEYEPNNKQKSSFFKEKMFKKPMFGNNNGERQIDHILSKEESVKNDDENLESEQETDIFSTDDEEPDPSTFINNEQFFKQKMFGGSATKLRSLNVKQNLRDEPPGKPAIRAGLHKATPQQNQGSLKEKTFRGKIELGPTLKSFYNKATNETYQELHGKKQDKLEMRWLLTNTSDISQTSQNQKSFEKDTSQNK